MEIKAIVISSTRYTFLLNGFYYLWNKYCDIPISKEIITSADKDNWCKDVLEGIKDLDCSHILLSLEDYYLLNEYNKETFNKLIKYDADKYDLVCQVAYWKNHNEGELFIADNDACYRRSLQMGIWKKEYLMYCLKSSTNPWNFELSLSNDNKRIVGFNTYTFKYANIMLKGSMMNYELDHLNKEDRIVINDLLKK